MEEAPMNRITPTRLALFTLVSVGLLVGSVATVLAASSPTPTPNSAVVRTRIFNDCPTSTVTVVNNYPSLISIEDANVDCFGFANLHIWRFSEDGTTEAVFDNNASFRFSSDFKIEGSGNGEGGLQIGVWYSHDADGLFNVRSTDGEIACFGGRLPFYTFTGAFGLRYTKGNTIGLGIIYEPRALNSARPATITYTVDYLGTHYTSGALPFDQANPAEDPPHGLWGILNDARVGGHFKAFLGQGVAVTTKASFSNIVYGTTPSPNSAVVFERVFNDCPTSTLVTTNNYPSVISFDDSNLDCFGFANLHVWQYSENGVDPAIFNNNANYRISTDFKIEGTGNGEGGLLIAPWYGKKTDGLFNVRSTDGEIACFGGRLPFFTFTGAFGLRYTKGDAIHLEAIYTANGRTAASPATIEYKLTYRGTSYSSGEISFDQANPTEDPPYGLYGMLNDGAVGGHFKAFLGQGNAVEVKATFSNIGFSQCLHPADVSFTLKPHKINLNSDARWATAYISAPDLDAIDVSSLRLNGVPASTSPFAPSHGVHNTLKVRFDQRVLKGTLSAGSNVPVQLTGEAGGQCIEATDFVDVSTPEITSPTSSSQVYAGRVTQVRWDVDPDATSMSLLSSTNGGESWSIIGEGIANTGAYNWQVPSDPGTTMLLELTAVYETDETGPVNQSEYAVSAPFTILSPLSVGGGSTAFALRVPNPVSGKLTMSISLPSAAPAELAVFDISGREMMKRDVGGHSGSQSLTVGVLPTGLYVVRLSQAGRSLSNRIAVVQ
jgi:hypothetical protein